MRFYLRKVSVLVLFLLSSLSAGAEASLRQLDEALKQSDYQVAKELVIAQKKETVTLAESDSDLLFWRFSELRDEYAFYQVDSAMVYSLKSAKVARRIGRLDYLTIARIHAVDDFIHLGMYIEAKEWLDSIRRKDIPQNQFESYYYQYNALYEALGECTDDLDLKYAYKQKEYAYKDSVARVAPGNIYMQSALLSAAAQDERALSILMDRFEALSENDRDIAPVAYAISLYYRRHGMRAEEKKYLVISAISDAKCAVKEYLSLRRLAEILYEEGDYARAYKYIVRCMDDAMFSGARLRMVQVSSVLPLIEGAYQHKLRVGFMLISISAVIILLLLVVLAVLFRQKHAQQAQLYEANKLLAESGAIKNVYIFNLLMECVSRIDTLDSYRKMLKRKMLNGDKSSVLDELKSTGIVDEQWRAFYHNFDKVFLDIFPSFIDGVNNLMSPENVFEKGDSLTVELRILALIRLGIEETDRIAAVLNYSKATIYSYRSRVRLKSKDPKNFEQKIKEIRSI